MGLIPRVKGNVTDALPLTLPFLGPATAASLERCTFPAMLTRRRRRSSFFSCHDGRRVVAEGRWDLGEKSEKERVE